MSPNTDVNTRCTDHVRAIRAAGPLSRSLDDLSTRNDSFKRFVDACAELGSEAVLSITHYPNAQISYKDGKTHAMLSSRGFDYDTDMAFGDGPAQLTPGAGREVILFQAADPLLGSRGPVRLCIAFRSGNGLSSAGNDGRDKGSDDSANDESSIVRPADSRSEGTFSDGGSQGGNPTSFDGSATDVPVGGLSIFDIKLHHPVTGTWAKKVGDDDYSRLNSWSALGTTKPGLSLYRAPICDDVEQPDVESTAKSIDRSGDM